MDRDRNLLFGIFAVQLKKVTPTQLMEVAGAWAVEPAQDLSHRLVEAGHLSEEDRKLLAGLVNQAVEEHDGDAGATLASFGGEEQVDQTYRGSIVLTESGGVKTVPAASPASEPGDPDSVPAVHESPGRYTHLSEYGRGGMGRVLLTHDSHLGRDIALKELLPGFGSTRDSDLDKPSPVRLSVPVVARFLQEARITGQLEHPSIVPVYELGHRNDGTLYYTMKLVRGKTFRQAIHVAQSFEERLRLLPHFVDLCQAIAYAHSRHVLHRDIKPGNVMVGEFGETVVLDWGLAKVKHREDVHADGFAETLRMMHLGDEAGLQRTAYGQAIGTPVYMPPEQAKGQLDEVDGRSDVYSLGAVLYELLTCTVPFEGMALEQILYQVIEDEPKSIRELVPNAPPELAAICERAMRKEPSERYESAKELAEDVQRFLVGGAVSAYTYRLGEHLRRFVRRHRAVLGTVAAAVLLLTVFGVYSYVRIWQEKQHAVREREIAEQELYFSNIGFAEQCVQDSNSSKASQVLAMCPAQHRGWEWGRLQLLCNLDEKRLRTGEPDTCCALSNTRDRYALGHMDGSVAIWDVLAEKRLVNVDICGAPVTALALNLDGTEFAVASEDSNDVRIWGVVDAKELALLQGHTGSVEAVVFGPKGRLLATASGDGSVKIWTKGTATALRTIQNPVASPAHLSFSPDGQFLAVGWGRTGVTAVDIWDLTTQSKAVDLPKHGYFLWDIEFSKDGKLFAVTCSADDGRQCEVTLWRVGSWEEAQSIKLVGYIPRVDFGPEDKRLLIRTQDRIVIWGIDDGCEIETLPVRCQRAWFNADGRQIITHHDQERYLGFWELADETRSHQTMATPPNVWPFGLAFTPDTKYIAASYSDGSVRLWHVESCQEVAKWSGTNFLCSFGFPLEGRLIPILRSDFSVVFCDAKTGEQTYTFKGHTAEVYSVDFSSDGRLMATGSGDCSARVWDFGGRRQVASLDQHQDAVRCVAFSPDDRYLATSTNDGQIMLWDVLGWKRLAVLEGHLARVPSVSFSPDGRKLASGSGDGTARIWDVSTGETCHVLGPHGGPVLQVAFSPDGRRLGTVGHLDNVAKVWDVETGRELLTLAEHEGVTNCIAFSPDGRWLATGGGDGKVILRWAFPTNTEDYPGGSELLLAERIEPVKREHWRRHKQIREETQACDEILNRLDAAKRESLQERGTRAWDPVESVLSILKQSEEQDQELKCPSGGEYLLGYIGMRTRCSVHGLGSAQIDGLAEGPFREFRVTTLATV